MLMETLIDRGGMPVRYRINGFEYVFRRNGDGHFVCPVHSGAHRKLLQWTGNFRVYVPKDKGEEPKDVPMIATRPVPEMSWTPKGSATAAVIESLCVAPGQPEAVTATEAAEPKRRGGRRRK